MMWAIFKKNNYYLMQKTLESIHIYFEGNVACYTCNDDACWANVTNKKNGEEYCVHISTNDQRSSFTISATLTSNTSSDIDINETFVVESDAVQFILETFDWSKCM